MKDKIQKDKIQKDKIQKEIEEFNKNIDEYYVEKRVLYLDDQTFYISSMLDNSITLVFLKDNTFYTAIQALKEFVDKKRIFLHNNKALYAFNDYYQKMLERAKETGMSLIYDKTTSIIMDRLSLFHNAYGSLHTTSVNFYGEFLDQ